MDIMQLHNQIVFENQKLRMWQARRGHIRLSPMSLSSLPDLHAELKKSWKEPYSARIRPFQHSNYVNMKGLSERGYVRRCLPIEEMLASFNSQGESSSLKAPALLSKPLQTTSRLNGRAYAAAGQVSGALHIMEVL